MLRIIPAAALLCAAISSPASARDSRFGITGEYTDFSGGFGTRRVSSAEYDNELGDTRLIANVAHGQRKYEDSRFSGWRAKGSVAHDWSSRFTSVSSIGVASNDPIFPRFEALQELSFKPGGGAVLTGAVRHARYFGGVEVNSAAAGASYYFPRGSVSYRLTGYDVEEQGHSHSHLLSARLTDAQGPGSTQVWLGAGSMVQALDWLPDAGDGKLRSVAVRRVQPVARSLALSIGAGHSWYKVEAGNYRGRSINLGIVINP